MTQNAFYIFYSNTRVVQYVTSDLQTVIASIDLSSVLTGFTDHVYDSETNRLFITSHTDNKLVVVDTINNVLLPSLTLTLSDCHFISIAGGYLFISGGTNNNLYKINKTTVTLTATSPTSSFFGSFTQYIASKNQILQSDDLLHLSVYDINVNNLGIDFTIPGNEDCNAPVALLYDSVKDTAYSCCGRCNTGASFSFYGIAKIAPSTYTPTLYPLSSIPFPNASTASSVVLGISPTNLMPVQATNNLGDNRIGIFNNSTNVFTETITGNQYAVSGFTLASVPNDVNYYLFDKTTAGTFYLFDVTSNTVTPFTTSIDTLHVFGMVYAPFTPPIPPVPPAPPNNLSVIGCTDPLAENYNPNANYPDGSCIYDPLLKLKCCAGDLAYNISLDAALGKKQCYEKVEDLECLISGIDALEYYIPNGGIVGEKGSTNAVIVVGDVAKDYSGNNNYGTPSTITPPTIVSSPFSGFDNCIFFDGVERDGGGPGYSTPQNSQYVNFGTYFNNPQGLDIEFKLQIPVGGTLGYIFNKQGDYSLDAIVSGAGYYLQWRFTGASGSVNENFGFDIPADPFVFGTNYTIRVTGGNVGGNCGIACYVNGTRVATNASGSTLTSFSTNPLLMGVENITPGQPAIAMTGYIDELRIYNSIQVSGASYTVSNVPYSPSGDGLYHFDAFESQIISQNPPFLGNKQAYADIDILTVGGTIDLTITIENQSSVILESYNLTFTPTSVTTAAKTIANYIQSFYMNTDYFYAVYGLTDAGSVRIYAPLSAGANANGYKIIVSSSGGTFIYTINGRPITSTWAQIFIGGVNAQTELYSCLSKASLPFPALTIPPRDPFCPPYHPSPPPCPPSNTFLGLWNALTNTPTLTNGIGIEGNYYMADVAGTQNFGTSQNWAIGDYIRYNGTVWQYFAQGSIAYNNIFQILQSICSKYGCGCGQGNIINTPLNPLGDKSQPFENDNTPPIFNQPAPITPSPNPPSGGNGFLELE